MYLEIGESCDNALNRLKGDMDYQDEKKDEILVCLGPQESQSYNKIWLFPCHNSIKDFYD